MDQFREQCTKLPQNGLNMFVVISTHFHTLCDPEAQIFTRFTLRRAIFKLWSNSENSAPNGPEITLTCSMSNMSNAPIFKVQMIKRTKFLSVCLYDENYGPIPTKVHRMTQTHLGHVRGQKYHVHTSRYTEANIFIHFAL